MRSRVDAIRAKKSVGSSDGLLVLAPHGFDDLNTTVIAEKVIRELGCYGVINHGWRRGDTYDYDEEIANCNNIVHLMQPVVKDEFFDSVMEFKEEMKRQVFHPFVCIIHGVGNAVRKEAPHADVIVGYGAGVNKSSYSCPIVHKNYFMSFLDAHNLYAYEGKAGGKYSGRLSTNLNQLFRHPFPDDNVYSLQLEITQEHRENAHVAEAFGETLANVLEDFHTYLNGNLKLASPKSIFPSV